MRIYTAKQQALLKSNPYTYKVTGHKLFFTIEFKEAFWNAYQAGISPRKIIEDLGYDLKLFEQKQIDSIVQRIKHQATCSNGFSQGANRTRRTKDVLESMETASCENSATMTSLINEVRYLRQEVEFLKKITTAANSAKKRS